VLLLTPSKVTDSDWTLAHGFYTLMGGFVIDLKIPYKTQDSAFTNGIERLALTPRGLLLLAKCGHLPKVSEEEILDKSKVDELGKLRACTQVTWMVVQVCTRLGLRLPVTLLEVTAVSHVVCALVLYALWWHKPRKVDEPTVLTGDWVSPLAAFMLMCSHESEGQILPGFHLKGEHSEMAGLKLVPVNSALHNDSSQIGQLSFVAKHEAALGHSFANAELVAFEGNIREAHADYSLPIRTQIPQSSDIVPPENVDPEGVEDGIYITTKTRWGLAHSAIQTYPAVRELLRSPSHGYNHKYETALATYPEMPLKCRLKLHIEDVDPVTDSWLECATQHLVTTVASNWPHDGLLRTTSGLWIGASLWLVSILYSGLHIAAWHATFPTKPEAWLWRSASLYVAFSGLLWAGIHVFAEFSARLWWTWYDLMSGDASRWLTFTVKIVCSICGLVYLSARAYLIVEAFIALRLLPVAAYVVPEWTIGVPHIA
jgi:hypothetical protein